MPVPGHDTTDVDPENAVSARLATEVDVAAIEALAEIARVEAFPTRGGELLLVHDKGDVAFGELFQLYAGEQHVVVVGMINDVVVGYGLAQSQIRGRVHSAMIDELFVHPEARTVGVAAAILATIVAWATAQGCDVIESQVLPGNRAAKNFFERVGMVTRKMQVSAPLSR